MDKKRIYIYDNIYKINDHKNLISIITSQDCKYTENSNGMFINLNTLNEDIIDNIYFLVYNETNSDIEEHVYDIVEPENIEKKEPVKLSKPKKECLMLDSFNEYDKEIIINSKIYKL